MSTLKLSAWLVVLLIILLGASLIPTGMRGTILSRELQNFAHVPTYGLLALALLISLRRVTWLKLSRTLQYLAAVLIATFIGLLVEFLQYLGPRDADLVDGVRNLLGASLFILLFALWEERRGAFKFAGAGLKFGSYILAFVLFFLSVTTPARWGLAYLVRNNQVPLICGFESNWEMIFLAPQEARLETEIVPPTWFTANSNVDENRAGQIFFQQGQYPGVSITEPYPDWSQYDFLELEIYSERNDTLTLNIRIDDAEHNNEFTDRFTGRYAVAPKRNRIKIRLDEIRNAPEGREFDLRRVAKVLFFLLNTDAPIELWIDNIRLGKATVEL